MVGITIIAIIYFFRVDTQWYKLAHPCTKVHRLSTKPDGSVPEHVGYTPGLIQNGHVD
jgi:hypothetical protein